MSEHRRFAGLEFNRVGSTFAMLKITWAMQQNGSSQHDKYVNEARRFAYLEFKCAPLGSTYAMLKINWAMQRTSPCQQNKHVNEIRRFAYFQHGVRRP